jgi:hypothetical protein
MAVWSALLASPFCLLTPWPWATFAIGVVGFALAAVAIEQGPS